MPKKIKISKSTVESIPLSDSGQLIFWDTSIAGFGIRVGAKRKTYIVQKKINGKDVKVGLGIHGQITAEKARKMATTTLADMTSGINPTDKKREAKAKSMNLQAVYEDFLLARKSLKPRTIKDFEYALKTYFLDWLKKPLNDITKDMVSKRHKKIGEGKGGKAQANQAMRYLRAIINFAIGKYSDSKGLGTIGINPVSVLSNTRAWYKIERRQTFIKPHEMPSLFEALDKLQVRNSDLMAETTKDYVLFLLFTGLRKQEAAKLKWEQVDFKDQTLTIADTKNGVPLTLPLSGFIQELLERRYENRRGEYVFSSRDPEKSLRNPQRQWDKIKDTSGLSFSPHDLRRTFTTIADSLDISSYAIKRLVNHTTNGDVTAGYIVRDVDRLRKPMQQITDKILSLAGKKETGQIISLHA